MISNALTRAHTRSNTQIRVPNTGRTVPTDQEAGKTCNYPNGRENQLCRLNHYYIQ